MDGLGYAAALLLAAVFARAGLAKLGSRDETAATFTALGLPAAAAVGVPVLELGLAVGLVLVPGWAAAGALAVLAAFTTFLARAVRAGVDVSCNCFGSARREPVSGRDLVRNVLLLAVGAVALTAESPTLPDPAAVALVLVAAAVATAGLRTVAA